VTVTSCLLYDSYMGDYIQLLLYIIVGFILLGFGHFLFFGPMSPVYPYMPWSKKKPLPPGRPGDPQVCPVCATRLVRGELVKTVAFATGVNSKDRIVYINGCRNCLHRNMPRRCPVCKQGMSLKDHLVSRMFDRPNQKNHIHVLGCNLCRKV